MQQSTQASKSVLSNTIPLLPLDPLDVNIPPPLMQGVLPLPLPLLIPRLRAQNIMHILHLIILPNRIVHTLPPHRLERIVHIRQRNPAPRKQVREERLVREIVTRRRSRVLQPFENQIIDGRRGVDDLETAVWNAQSSCWRGPCYLGSSWVGMLRCESAVGWYPVSVSPIKRGIGGGHKSMQLVTYQSLG